MNRLLNQSLYLGLFESNRNWYVLLFSLRFLTLLFCSIYFSMRNRGESVSAQLVNFPCCISKIFPFGHPLQYSKIHHKKSLLPWKGNKTHNESGAEYLPSSTFARAAETSQSCAEVTPRVKNYKKRIAASIRN